MIEEFQEFRKILCVCPCCGDIVRLSDLRIRSKGPVAKTWLDEYDGKMQALSRREEKFDEKEQILRERARKKGRIAAEKAVNNAISPALRALKLDPFDVKAILNPVDFVVFDGMNKTDSVSSIVFLSKLVRNKELNLIRRQVKKAVVGGKYEWQVARIGEDGGIGFG